MKWDDGAWRAEALGWVNERLGAIARPPTGEPEQTHAMPWSTVFRVPTAAGPVWFKANNAGTAYEAALVDALGRWCPDRVVAPLAADTARGWLLMPDGGTTLRAAQRGDTDLDHWQQILVEYADLQRLLVARADELVRLGVPDLRPTVLAEARARLLAEERWLRLDLDDGMSRADLQRLRGDQQRYAALCAELDAYGVPASLQHDDLHDNNVFVANNVFAANKVFVTPGHYRVFDWGDSSVSHPFGTLLVTLRVVAHLLKLANGAPELLRMRDAYLEAWTSEYDVADLREAARLAARLGSVARALSYRRSLVDATPEVLAEHGDAVPGWLQEWWEPTPLESAPSA